MPPQTHVVRPGDTPAKIAIAHAGCPKCARDLVAANPHKQAVVYPNGFKTFKEMREGEELKLPQKWFSAAFDRLPPTYFAALPHPDGVTPSKLGVGAAGVLGDYATLDAAVAAVSALAALDDRSFNMAAPGAAVLIDQSISEVTAASAYAQATHIGTNWANARNDDLTKALATNDQSATMVARQATQLALGTALDSAQLALQAFYGGSAPGGVNVDIGPAQLDVPTLLAAAQAVATAISSSPDFCNLVAQPGSVVNAAVHAFKAAWNAANPNNPVPIATGNYEQATANVLAQVLGSAPPACAARVTPPVVPAPAPTPAPAPFPDVTPPLAQAQPQSPGLSTGAVLGLATVGATVVGAIIYVATR